MAARCLVLGWKRNLQEVRGRGPGGLQSPGFRRKYGNLFLAGSTCRAYKEGIAKATEVPVAEQKMVRSR